MTRINRADLLLRHGRILTVDADRRILPDGAIAIADGRIVAVGPDRLVATSVETTETHDLAGRLVHPGFVDAHVHTISDLTRGLVPEQIEPARAWREIKNPFYEIVTPEEEHAAALLACMEMVSCGTTTYADTGGSYALAETAAAIEAVGLRGVPGYFISDLPMAVKRFLQPTETCLQLLGEQLDHYPFHAQGRVGCAVTMAGMGSASDRLLMAAADLARRRSVPMIMHQSWSEEEVAFSHERYGRRPIQHLDDVGILGPHLTLVHMIAVDEAEIDLVARSGTRVVHCPAESARGAGGALRHGLFPEMLSAGIPVALGTDGPNGRHDLWRSAFLVALMYKELRGRLPMITAEAALEMATIHGAAALGMQDDIGSLEAGKRADLVVHRTDQPTSYPHYDLVQNLIYAGGSSTIEAVYVDGEVIYQGGHFTRLDAHIALRRVDEIAQSLIRRIGVPTPPAWPVET